uniref:Cytochrome b n=1 Tax=Hebesoma violentum TaxID=1410563 RepID=A0A0C4JQE9_9BILA|nr:cytochrome b [Hebesoma violentum]
MVSGVKSLMLNLPSPVGLNWGYKLGSMLGFVYGIQVLTGFLLSLFYSVQVEGGYTSVVSIMMDTANGWVIRLLHSFGSSALFMLLYLHVFRGLSYSGVKNSKAWLSGLLVFMVCMGVSFLGYVLPWGQMSYWGMTVVTSMLGAFPVLGSYIVGVLWGSSVAGVISLVRFYSLHYLLSLVMGLLAVVHIVVLHEKGSSNPLGVYSSSEMIVFSPGYVMKDLLGFVIVVIVYWLGLFFLGYLLMDEVNFEEVNYLSTPSHIKPEWYFLFAYCILRSVNSKLGGVLLMFGAIGVLILFSVFPSKSGGSESWVYLKKFVLCLVGVFFSMLVLLGGLEVDFPYDYLSKLATVGYFSSVGVLSLVVSVV